MREVISDFIYDLFVTFKCIKGVYRMTGVAYDVAKLLAVTRNISM